MSIAERFLLIFSGIAGATGIAFSAMAAHGNYPDMLKTCADILLVHAPVLLGITALIRVANTPRRLLLLAGFLLVLGIAFFCGDLARRTFLDLRLFPMAAPVGGSVMILGWAFLVLAALMPRRL
ncbi:MAG: DUF423 domain-containing protein [Burkholderiales bacterium]|jgi:uncharacterized membrane protein YgdD (TMEM256/DUF423 family)|nr:DUF423 domain-containing protein [Burkholderiales bacterium]